MDPTGASLAHIATHRHLHSARPDAPVVPDRPGRHERRLAAPPRSLVRRTTAGALRRLANRLEPDPCCQ